MCTQASNHTPVRVVTQISPMAGFWAKHGQAKHLDPWGLFYIIFLFHRITKKKTKQDLINCVHRHSFIVNRNNKEIFTDE